MIGKYDTDYRLTHDTSAVTHKRRKWDKDVISFLSSELCFKFLTQLEYLPSNRYLFSVKPLSKCNNMIIILIMHINLDKDHIDHGTIHTS